MADVIDYRFRMRRALAATWTSLNDILLEGEYGYEKDTGKVKIGDGVTAWNDLGYFAGSGGAGLIVSETEPTADLVNGLEWLDPVDGTRYTYYDDGDTQQWVEFGPETQLYVVPKVSEGTAFPVGPADGAKFYRTDLDLLCFFNSIEQKWLSVQEYSLGIGTADFNAGATPGAGVAAARWPVRRDYGMFLTHWDTTTLVIGNNGSSYYTVTLQSRNAANASSNIESFNTASDTSLTWVDHAKEINATLDASAMQLQATISKTGSPGAYHGPSSLYYRLIVEDLS